MSALPQVSVLLPVYNAGRYLREALDSLLAQTLAEFEVVAIDDGSSDSSPAILAEYAARDARVRVVRNEKNMGLAATLNKGLALCRAALVARFDADDVCLPSRLEKQTDFMRAHPETAICGAWMRTIGSREGMILRYPSGDGRIRCRLLFHCPIGHPSVMLRRETLLEAGLLYNPEFEGVEDYELWIRARKVCRFDNLPEPLVLYRLHDSPLKQGNRYDARAILRPAKLDLLRELGLGEDARGNELHERISSAQPEDTWEFLRAADGWLRELLAANGRHGSPYPEAELRAELARQWFGVCYHAREALGAGVWPRFAVSPLGWMDSNIQRHWCFALRMLPYRLQKHLRPREE